jgi:hypothetical protein
MTHNPRAEPTFRRLPEDNDRDKMFNRVIVSIRFMRRTLEASRIGSGLDATHTTRLMRSMRGLQKKRVNRILHADIKGFFNHVSLDDKVRRAPSA